MAHTSVLEDTMKILIATDIHLGYAENDPIRGDDSFNTFEEILSIASQQEVDMIILGGDLFHDNKPSPKCIYKCMALIRNYCLGDRPVSIEFLSDQSENFQNATVNYEDPNLNISIPIFSIHGNHDDPSGLGRISSLDILSASGLVNYFGTWSDLKLVEVSPLLMRKGETYLALFGLSHIPDDRLSRLFRSNKVNFYRPKEQADSWFNMFVLHQNRVNRGFNKYIEDTMIPPFFDLVMWGHEHECLIHPDWNSTQDFRITQPGSPVATSLCEGEAVKKHVAILKINKKKFHLQPIPLQTVRPFIMDTIILSKCRVNLNSRNVSSEVQKYVEEYISSLIERAENQLTGHEKQPTLPLIRLRVDYLNQIHAFNPVRFGQKFHGKIANPDSLIRLMRERKESEKGKEVLDIDAMQDLMKKEPVSLVLEHQMEAVIEEYFKNTSQSTLEVLSIKGLSQATSSFVTKDDKCAIADIVNHQCKKVLEYLRENAVPDDNIAKAIQTFKAIKNSQGEEMEVKEALSLLEDEGRRLKILSRGKSFDDDDDDNNDEVSIIEDASDDDSVTSASTRGRGRGRGRARGRGRGRSEASNTGLNASTAGTTRARGRGRGARIMF